MLHRSNNSTMETEMAQERSAALARINADPIKLANAQLKAAHIQAHYDFLTTRQRESGMRMRLCSTGCFSLYNAAGQFIGRTAPPSAPFGVPPASLKTTAACMAHSDEMAQLCRQVDADYEHAGAVSPETIGRIRELLSAVGVA